MGQVDALRMTDNVRSRLVDLAVSENHVRDSLLSNAAQTVWEGSGLEGGLISEIWVEGAFPGKQSLDTLESLSADGLFPEALCNHLSKRDVFPKERSLYNHQAESIRKANLTVAGDKTSLVITAGTGLGKTEAFLLPMLADLWEAPPRRENGGMRCLILYPMNALVTDQVERIYNWLKGQKSISVFHFTSETPEDSYNANKQGFPHDWEACRMRTRQEARGLEDHKGSAIKSEPWGSVPDIVITNYSMLEYMLCRPQDARFFGPDLRSIILDEAHLYSGTLAAEIMMLLRRLRDRCGLGANEVRHIATSATLGGTDSDLLRFASTLFSTKMEATEVIRGRYADHAIGDTSAPPSKNPEPSEIASFSNIDLNTMNSEDELIDKDATGVETLLPVVRLLTGERVVQQAQQNYPNCPARFLHETLKKSPVVREMAQVLSAEKGSTLSLTDLTHRLFGNTGDNDAQRATIALLRLSAAARLRASDLPLIPHRLHWLVRAPEGLSVCLNSKCSGPKERILPPVGALQPLDVIRCHYCGHVKLPIHRCNNCGEWTLAAHENQELSIIEPGYFAPSADRRTYYLLVQPASHNLESIVIDTEQAEIRGFGAEGLTLYKAPRVNCDSPFQHCPTCKSVWTVGADDEQRPDWKQVCQGFIGGRPFALSVAAETILHDLPAYLGESRNWKAAEGRRLLAFSDSRASAARLGPLLTQQHEIQVVRAAMARCAKGLAPASMASYWKSEVERLREQLADKNVPSDLKSIIEVELAGKVEKLNQAENGTPFEDFALLVGQRSEMAQILDRDCADRHFAESYEQCDWKKNVEAVKGHSQGLIAKEIERPLKTRASVESVGLIEVAYPNVDSLRIPPLLEEALPANVRQKISSVWPQLVVMTLDTVRGDGCIDWSLDTPNRHWLGESPLPGRLLTRTRGGWGARALVGATPSQLRRRFLSNALKTAGCTTQDAEDLSHKALCAMFDQLFADAGEEGRFPWLRREDHHQTGPDESDKALKILLDRLSVRSPRKLYKCDATGTVWTSSALGWAPIDGNQGTLREISPDELDKDTRWGRSRREFLESPILNLGLWAEEHSAQLSPQENRRLQDLFKSGIRNILSSTTTMELGIDIGGLNGVLLGNVPPGPANHRQRAGRAGRRSDGSAVVVTFSRGSTYDREVFHRFGDFLRRELRKPTVFSDRPQLIQRHLHAVLLSEFLRSQQPMKTGAMQAFGRMGAFCGLGSTPSKWTKATDSKPVWEPDQIWVADQFITLLQLLEANDTGYKERLAELSKGTPLEAIVDEARWANFITLTSDIFKKAIREWRNDITQLRTAWDEIPLHPKTQASREMAKANSIRNMVKSLSDITVIEWLANRRFLPRYGFPINLQRLSIRKAIENGGRDYSEPDERYRLERSSLLALTEYVPESKVLVGGRVATSRGLRKHWTDNNVSDALGLQYFALECSEGHVYIRQAPDDKCPKCDSTPVSRQQLVFPRFGYTTAGWDKLPLGTNLERIGQQSVCPTSFAEPDEGVVLSDFAGIKNARMVYRDEAILLVRNAGRRGCGFAICTRCGFAMSEVAYGLGRIDLPKNFISHASIFSSNPKNFCWPKGDDSAPVLRNRVLAARELTEMALLEWPGGTIAVRDGLYSFGRALVLAGTRLLELDERELGVELMPLRNDDLGIVIYDTSPGGAGHCRELIGLGIAWIQAARNVLYVNETHHLRCSKACLDCILDFSGQHVASRLDRHAALALIDKAMV